MELTIESTKFYNNADRPLQIRYQAWLIIGDVKQEIGRQYDDYRDCRFNCEKIVKEFYKNFPDLIDLFSFGFDIDDDCAFHHLFLQIFKFKLK